MVPLLSLQHLQKTYFSEGTETTALVDVSFTIESGEFVAIMGPSGSGKSTLLHVLGFLDQETKGTYQFQGKTLADYSGTDIAHVRNETMGFIFQAFHLLPRTTVVQNVILPLLYSKIPESKWQDMAEKAIKSVGLSHRLHHESQQLSGGEKQRVAIARALVLRPKIIFADEPTGNLDSESGKIVMDLLKKLNEEDGHTIVLITHESSAASYANRIMSFHDGKVVNDRLSEKKPPKAFQK